MIISISTSQCEYNAISYNDQMRLRTAVELLKTTKEIESQLEKVSIIGTFFSVLFEHDLNLEATIVISSYSGSA